MQPEISYALRSNTYIPDLPDCATIDGELDLFLELYYYIYMEKSLELFTFLFLFF